MIKVVYNKKITLEKKCNVTFLFIKNYTHIYKIQYHL